jgi:hypothetical protein
VRNDLALLAPEFRAPLERVIERMHAEHGHTVTVVETRRDPARQDALFAQGRTEPGPVVTWTRNSRHLVGMAADVIIDGTYESPVAYQRLAQIAREEGLRTLGPRDPGHVELAAANAGSVVPARSAATHATSSQVAQVAQVATVARVAEVAVVAEVAPVARVATVAHAAPPARSAATGSPGAATAPASESAIDEEPAAAPVVESDNAGRSALPDDHDGAGRRGEQLGAPAAPATSSMSTAALRDAGGVTGADVAERIARVLQLQNDAALRPLSQMVLRLDAEEGSEMIRVGVRGTAVDAMLALRDGGTATRAQAQLGELHRALTRHGLTTDSLHVQLMAAEALDGAARLAPVTNTATGSRTDHQPGDGQLPARDHRGGGGEQSSSRHRSRQPYNGDS